MGKPTNNDPYAKNGPSSDPFATPPGPTATQERKNSPAEGKEAPKKSATTLDDLRRKAEKVESEPNKDAADAIRRLRGSKKTAEQLDGLTALNQALTSVLVKLAKKGMDISAIQSTEQLKREIVKNAIQLDIPEAVAVENLDRIASEPGETSEDIRKSWPDTVKTSKEASKGFGAKYMDHLKTNPGGTIALTIAGAAGLYLTYQGVSALVGKAFGVVKGKAKDVGPIWKKKEVILPIAALAMGAGGYLGKDVVAKILADAGLNFFDVENKVKKGEEFTADQQKRLQEAGKKIQTKVDEEKAKRGEAPAPAPAQPSAPTAPVAPTSGRTTPETTTAAPTNTPLPAPMPVVPGALETSADKKETLTENAEKIILAESPLTLMINIFYYNDFEFDDSDKSQIGSVVETMRQKKTKVSELLKLWGEYNKKSETNGEIPNQNSLGTFEDGIEKKNIYRAVRMIAMTAEEYKKRSNVDFSQLTVEDFLEKNLATDPTQKMHNVIQMSIIESIKEVGVTDILSFNNIKFGKIQDQLQELAKEGWKDVVKSLGINFESLDNNERKQLGLIVAYLMGHARLDMKWEDIIKETNFPKNNVNEKTMATAKDFFEKMRDHTVKDIIPAAVTRFNFGPGDVKDKANADIIKNNLNQRLTFKDALYLNIVTKDLDLAKDIKTGGSGPQEAAFLFTVLNCLDEGKRTGYTSVLLRIVTEYPQKFPSLALIVPYLNMAANFGIDCVVRKVHHLRKLTSELMPNRSYAEQEAWFKRMKDAPMLQWGLGTAREASFGTISIGWEILEPLIKSGEVTYAEIGQCEDAWDFIMLVKKAGGTLIYHEDENGTPHGWFHLAGNTFAFRPYGTVKETLSAALKGDPSGAFKVWSAGVAPFVTLGAIRGYYLEKCTTMGHLPYNRWVKGAAWGGAKSFVGYPYWALKKSLHVAQYSVEALANVPKAIPEYASRPVQSGLRVGKGVKDFTKYGSLAPGQNVPNMLENGRRLDYYFESSKFKEMEWVDVARNMRDSEGRGLLKRRLVNGFDTSMAIRYARRFADDYNDFFKYDKGDQNKLFKTDISNARVDITQIDKAKKAYIRTKIFFENGDKYDAHFKEMLKETEKGLSRDKLQTRFGQIIKKMGGLEPDEVNALASQLKNKEDVLKLQKRVQEGFKAFENYAAQAAKAASRGRIGRLWDRVRRAPEPANPADTPVDSTAQPAEPAEPDSGPKSPKADAEPAKPKSAPEPSEKPVRVKGSKNKWSYKGEEFEISNNAIKKIKKDFQIKSDAHAIEAICDQRWNRPSFLRTTADGSVYRFRGAEFILSAEEVASNSKILSSLETKYASSIAATAPTEAAATASDPGTAAERTSPAEAAEGRGAKIKRGAKRAGQNLLGETLHSVGGSEKALTQAGKDLEEVRKKISAAEKALQDIADARAAGQDVSQMQKAADSASEAITAGRSVEAEIENFQRLLRSVRETEDIIKAAKTGKSAGDVAKLEIELRTATLAAEEAMKSSGKAMQGISRLGKVGTYIGKGWRVAGGGLAVVGVGVSAYSAVTSGWEAATTHVEGRGVVKGGEALMWTASGAVDALAVGALLGAEGAGFSFGAAVALPLAPAIYAGSKVFETLNEDTRTSAEWIQGDPYVVLQNFYTTMNSCALGDAWISGVGLENSRFKNQRETTHRIFRALIAMQNDKGTPPIQSLMADKTKTAEEKDKAIEARIKNNVTRYHEFYFNEALISGVQTYADAQKFILEAQMFNDIMQRRDEAKKNGKAFILMGNDKIPFSLHLDRYSITEDGKKKDAQYNPTHVVQAYKETMVKLFERDPIRKMNLDRMDNGYLLMVYMQIAAALHDPGMQKQLSKDGLGEDLNRQAKSIALYLATARGVNMTFAGEHSKPEPRWSLTDIDNHLSGIGSVTNQAFLDYEKKEYKMTPALNALYKLGEYFGYAGPPKEEQLKEFFKKEAASGHGLYWDGSEWMLQERGMEFDDSFGPTLNNAMIEKLIVRMKEQPDNILEHRNDSVFLDSRDYTNEVMRMAKVLENGLAVGNQRNYAGKREESAKEKGTHVDYTKKADLQTSYKTVIEGIKTRSDINWTQLNYEVKSDNSIILKRIDGSATVELTRTGETWSIGNLKSGLTLMQAVALGNLKNWAQQWMEKGKIKGGADRPFEIDGDAIDFDVEGTPIDRNFLKGWIGFYGEIGISKEMAVDFLNNWYAIDVLKGVTEAHWYK